ncbi:TRAP-type mannitol/chloroaromatic compound transport system permease small subunit [Litoreibacter ponti]|uniref:TRAP transporter small permease protein n=1 Tax=Litoreibacter ponti TaxID=1510457 RepID=A0A2T6BDS9_9RHOB|nr:TRAP transporter small permease [Litoreibacter ponti]PTX54225.1 TRAP-type mannitol/chloroaromatic compound transport system permease small subunit [Litoreibacter ponti]
MQDQELKHGTAIEWLVPLAFVICAGWVTWHIPAFTLDWAPPENQSARDNLAGIFLRNDVTPNMGGLFGGYADAIDWLALVLLPVFLVLGVMTVRRAPMEFEAWGTADRLSVFIGRITMMLIVLLVLVMLYEVLLRYVFEAPTLWANELSLWIAGFIFLTAGLYAMQQRSHIRIFLLYDVCPWWMQKLFDCISTLLIIAFAFFLIYGGYGEAFSKFYRWETFGTAFDPPIPATVKPAVLFIVALVAVQAVVNLIADWNAEPVIHTAADDIDEDEIARLRAAVGAEGTGDLDVTRGAIQGSQTKAKKDDN